MTRKERVDVTTTLPDASPEYILSLSPDVEAALIGEECERSICCGVGGGAADIVDGQPDRYVAKYDQAKVAAVRVELILELAHNTICFLQQNAQYSLSSQQCIRFYVVMYHGPFGGYHTHHLPVQYKPSRRFDYFFYKSVSFLPHPESWKILYFIII